MDADSNENWGLSAFIGVYRRLLFLHLRLSVLLMSWILPAREDSFGDFTAVGKTSGGSGRSCNGRPAGGAGGLL